MIILISWPYNKRSYYRLGIDVLEKRNIDFKILNLFDLLYPESKTIYNEREFHKREIVINSYKELYQYLKEEEFILNFLNIKKNTLSVFGLLTLLNKNYISFDNMPLPRMSNYKTNILKYFLKPASIGAVVAPVYHFPFSRKTKFINIHSADYDEYLRFEKTGSKPLIKNNDYYVFIDQNLPFHLDFIRNGIKPYVTSRKYYDSLNKFFDYIEKETQKEVIIALHPNSSNKHNFKKRTFIHETINLIKYSKGVIIHSSTAVSFAAIYNKPLCMIETEEIVNSEMHQFNKLFASILNIKPLNIDKTFRFQFEFPNYTTYYKTYITSSSFKDMYSMEILLKELKL